MSPAVSSACCRVRWGSGGGGGSINLPVLPRHSKLNHPSLPPRVPSPFLYSPPPLPSPSFSRCPISAAKSHQGRLGLLDKVLSRADNREGRREERCAGVMRGRQVNLRETGSSCGGGGFNTNTWRSMVLHRIYRWRWRVGVSWWCVVVGWWGTFGSQCTFSATFSSRMPTLYFFSHFYSTLPAQTFKLNWYCGRDKSALLQLCLPAELPSWKNYAHREPKAMRYF